MVRYHDKSRFIIYNVEPLPDNAVGAGICGGNRPSVFPCILGRNVLRRRSHVLDEKVPHGVDKIEVNREEVGTVLRVGVFGYLLIGLVRGKYQP